MARGDNKADVRALIRAHRATYVNATTGRVRPADHLTMEALPTGLGAAAFLWHLDLTGTIAVGLLTVAGLLGAFFFAAMLQVSDRAMGWADSQPVSGPDTSAHARFLTELAANAGYASLVSIVTSVVFVVASASHKGWPVRVSSAVGVAVGAHLVLTLFMVMKRVHGLTEERLTWARTNRDRST